MSTFLKGLKLTYLKSSSGLIHLGNDQSGNAKDLGFVGEYNDGSSKFSGLVRDASDGRFVLFDSLSSDPTSADAIDVSTATKAPLDILDLKVTSTKEVGDVSGAAALKVDGGVTVGKKLLVSSSDSLEALKVTGGATLGAKLLVESQDVLQALQVSGGATLGEKLWVKSIEELVSLQVDGGATVEKKLLVKSSDALKALQVTGGVTVGAKLEVTSTSQFKDDISLDATKTVTLGKDPTEDMHAATKRYVDNVAQGLDVKKSVKVLSSSDVPLVSIPSPLVIDSVTVLNGDRVLLNGQTDATQNGIYIYNSAAGTLVRSLDANDQSELTDGAFTFVEQGTVNQNTGWVLGTNDTVVIGTTPISFTQFSSAGILNVVNLSTADNVNVAHLYKEKVGNDFRFYALGVSSSVASGTASSEDLISIDTDTGSDEVTINFDQSKISGLGDVTSGSISVGFGDITLDSAKSVSAGTFSVMYDAGAGDVDSMSLNVDSGVNKLSFLTRESEIVIPSNLVDSLKIVDAASNDYITFQSGSAYQYMEFSKDVHLKENFNESVIDISVSTDLANSKGCIFRVDAASGNVVVTLPPATASHSVGRNIKIIRVDSSSNTVTVQPQAVGGLINGEINGFTLELQHEHVKVTSDGAGWYTM